MVGRDQQALVKSKRTFGKEIRMNDILQNNSRSVSDVRSLVLVGDER